MRNALRYACRRAKRTGGRVAMLYVMDPPEGQQWGSVVELMREEARQQAEDVVARHADVAVSMTGQPPSIYIREGKSRDELAKLLAEDRSISVLVLGSASSSEGPGPLVTAFTGKLGRTASHSADDRPGSPHRGGDRRDLMIHARSLVRFAAAIARQKLLCVRLNHKGCVGNFAIYPAGKHR